MLAAFLCFMVGMVATVFTPWFLILGISGFLAFLTLNLWMMFGVRCPSCGGNLGSTLSWPPQLTFKVPEKIRFCQYCGTSFDKDITEDR